MLERTELRPPADRLTEDGEGIPIIELMFGQFLPSDRAIIIQDIVTLFREKIISRNTAIRLLMEDAGLNVRDASDEVTLVEHEDFEGARILAETLQSPETAAEYLDIEIEPMGDVRKEQQQLETESAVAQAQARGFGGGNNPQGNGQQGQNQNQ
jgi:hypothetical protein